MSSQNIEKIYDYAPSEERFLDAVLAGLGQDQKQLPCKFFYDARGSQLFDAICKLDEYYPTRTELTLLEQNRAEIASLIGPGSELVEFGCGSLQKIRVLLGAMIEPAAFVPIDISREHLVQSAQDLAEEFPDLAIRPVVADYTQPLDLPVMDDVGKRVGFFPGSTIGNFTPREAVGFLKVVAGIVGAAGELLIGVDLKKDEDILNAAYNDAAGVTAEFNLNLLRRINRELGANFTLDAFRHHAFYSQDRGRIEMHIESLEQQTVRINGSTFDFAQGETIHTENSHKYGIDEFQGYAAEAGFEALRVWVDPDNLFSVHYLRVG